ncbi:hypothetical protein [Zobellia nedashkovskayae]|uniref:hypothetical protein n=1 Tax=Zobellia nedashkovskayae TaxID=2779510 RepID=UPI00188B99E9|nr:hypothetical protein [Zobellia nedashkovskayae]
MDNSTIGIIAAIGISFFILYKRKKEWLNPKTVWLICAGLLIFGLYGLLFLKPELRQDRAMFFGFCVPIVYWIFDRIFKRISENRHQRDFILFLRYSDEINDGFRAENPHVEDSDKFFSIALLVIVVTTLVIGLSIIGK